VSIRRLGRLAHLVFIFYFLEAGAFLVMSPWSRFWTARVVLLSPRRFQILLSSPYFRGFVAGLGLLHLIFAVRELERWRRAESERPLLRRLADEKT
jgi:hypothetical protein